MTASLRRLLSSICRWSTGLIVLTEEYLCTSLSALVGVRSVSTHRFGDSTDDDSGLLGTCLSATPSSATSSTTSSPPASVAPASTFSHLDSNSHSFAGVLNGSSREGGT